MDETTGRRCASRRPARTTMQYGIEEGAKSGFASLDALLEKIAA